MVYGVLNIMTGVVVEHTINASEKARAKHAEIQAEKSKKFLEQIDELFIEVDSDGSGIIDRDEFEQALENKKVRFCFSKLQHVRRIYFPKYFF